MLRLFLALLLLLTSIEARADGFGIGGSTNIDGQNARSQNETVTLTRGSCVGDTNNATTYNFTNVGTGSTETDTGLIVIAAMGEDTPAFTVDAIVVNGTPLIKIVDEGGTGTVNAALYRGEIEMKGGTLATVDLTFSEGVSEAALCVWFLKNLRSLTPTSSVDDDDAASAALVLTTGTTTSGGFVVGACVTAAAASTTTWAVLTEREDTTAGTAMAISNADAAATGSSMANTCDWTNTSNAAGVAAAFR